MLSRRELRTLQNWGEALAYCDNYEWNKSNQKLMIKLIHEIQDFSKNTYQERKISLKKRDSPVVTGS